MWLAWLALGLAGTGCAANPFPTRSDHAAAEAGEPAQPVTDYLPAAGIRWLLLVRPRVILAEPSLRRATSALISPARFAAFTEATGVELERVPLAAIAAYDLSSVYAAQTPWNNTAVEMRFSERLSAPMVRHPASGLTRVSGLVDGTPRTLLRGHDRFAVIAVGDPTPARAAEAFALGSLRRSPRVLQGAAFGEGFEPAKRAALAFLIAGPFQGGDALVARTDAAAIWLDRHVPRGPRHTVVVRTELRGDFELLQRSDLIASWQRLASSSLGSVLGLGEPVRELEVSVAERSASIEAFLDLELLANGLADLLRDDALEFDPAKTLRIVPGATEPEPGQSRDDVD